MEAIELRLGNKIYSNELDIDNGCEVLQIVDCDYYAIHEILRGNKVNKYSQIPITEQLLLQIGFEKVNHIHGYAFFTLSKSKKNKCHIDIYDSKTNYMGYSVKHCKYLHELQNLFYAITGSELFLSGI
jgi:hypothetical protein